jgi:hypothetical protein
MSDLLTLGASAMSGGVFGVLGTALGRGVGLAERVLSDRQERAKWAHDLDLKRLDQAGALAAADATRRQTDAEGGWRGLEASHASDAAVSGGYQWVQAVRALVRPTLTLLLWLVAAAAAFAAIDAGEIAAFARFTDGAAFAATAATLWWFGDRAVRPASR